MSGGLVESVGGLPWVGFFAVGSVGISLVAWLVFVRSREPVRGPRSPPGPSPLRDAVSLARDAADGARFTPLLNEARLRLNAWSVRTTGFTLDRLPGRLSRDRRSRAPPVRDVRRLRGRLSRLQWRAAWLESKWVPRWDPWRTPENSVRIVRGATAAFLGELDRRWYGGTERT